MMVTTSSIILYSWDGVEMRMLMREVMVQGVLQGVEQLL